MSRFAIRAENLSKRYRIGSIEERPETLVGAMTSWLRSPVANFSRLRRLTNFSDNGQDAEDVIWALKDVSFEVTQGEVVGIIGANGAGKTTLLKILSRITEPTSGRAVINGRVSSLLEVGTGFHPDLTGRENVYLNGTVLGMSKVEVHRKFDEIVAFSGVEKFIDTPVKRYSSGMQVRLAFSVAAHLEPEILLVDEVLAVGDVQFQKKCIGKMGEVASEGRTVLFVSHSMEAIARLCTSAMLIEQGMIANSGEATEVIDSYLARMESGSEGPIKDLTNTESEQAGVVIKEVGLFVGGEPSTTLPVGESLEIAISLWKEQDLRDFRLAIIVEESTTGERVFTVTPLEHSMSFFENTESDILLRCKISSVPLVPGRYYLTLAIGSDGVTRYIRAAHSFTVFVPENSGAEFILTRSKGLIWVEAFWELETAEIVAD